MARSWALTRLGRVDDREPIRLDEDLIAQFKAMGAELPAIVNEDATNETIEIMPQNWPSVNAFFACQTQWRVVARMGELIWLGLDYLAVDVVLKRIEGAADSFDDLREMEHAALEVFAEGEA